MTKPELMDRPTFDMMMTHLCAATGGTLTTERLTVYWRVFFAMDVHRLAFTLHTAQTRFTASKVPTVGQLIALSKEWKRPTKKHGFGGKYVTLQEALTDPDPYFIVNAVRYNIRDEWEKLEDEMKKEMEELSDGQT